MATVTIVRYMDRRIAVEVDGEEVASANYDEHGWSGLDAVEKTAVAVARAAGLAVDEREGDD